MFGVSDIPASQGGRTALARIARARTRARDDVALRVSWRALWTSRVVILLAGVFGVLSFGRAPGTRAYDPSGLTTPFGYFGNLLVSPLARWDSVWYLAIADGGYTHEPARTAFFPLYPLLIKAVGAVVRSDLLGGVLVSLACFLVGLVVVHRLVELELGRDLANLTVVLLALCPMSFYFSAVYSESLFLALSAGCILQARRGRWARAGLLGALAAMTRNSGLALVVPIVVLFLYGPRADRPPPVGVARGGGGSWLARLRPRYPLSPALAWVALVPVGLLAYLAFVALTLGDGLWPLRAPQVFWLHQFAGPFGGVVDGAVAAWDGLRQLIHGPAPPTYFTAAAGDPLAIAGQNLALFGFVVVGAIAVVGALRVLPLAYGAYALAALALPLSTPVAAQPLMSLSRYEVVLFPLFMWGAVWLDRHRLRLPGLAALAVLLGLFTAEFATWRFVA